MSDIDRIIREGKRSIGNTESATRERLAQRYREAFDRIERELAYVTGLLQDIDAGELVTARGNWTRRGLEWRQQRLSGLLRLIDDEYDRLAALGVQDIAQGQRTLLVRGADDAYRLAEASGITTGVGAALNTEAYAGLTAALGADSPVYTVLQSYGPFAAKVIERGIITGAMQGWGVDRILRDIRRQIPDGYPPYRLEALLRTELMRAYRGGLNDAYQQLGVQQVRWVAALQTRTCAACLAMHGTLHPIDYQMESHVSCRCVLAPATGLDYDQPTGEEWLRGLPPDQQRKVFPTQGHYDAWRDGLTLQDMTGRTRSRVWGDSVTVKPLRDVQETMAARAAAAAKPKRIAKPKPAGHKIEEAFEIYAPDPKQRKQIDTATKAINKVHGQEGLPRIPLESDVHGWTGASHGMYRSQGDKPFDILIDNTSLGQHRELTTVHEIGHFIDHMGLGTPGVHSSSAGELAQWSAAVRNSRLYNRLDEIRGMDRIEYIDPWFNQPTSEKIDKVFVDYLMTDDELFARSYAQFIANRSGNKTLLNQVEAGRGIRPDAPTARDSIIPTQWEEDDFAEIDAAFIDLFRERGWIK